MKSSKSSNKSFQLDEAGGTASVNLKVEGDYGIDYEIQQCQKVRVRAPRPTRRHIEQMAEFWASVDPESGSVDGHLRQYANSMTQEIIGQKPIQSFSYCVKTAQQIAQERSESTGTVTVHFDIPKS